MKEQLQNLLTKCIHDLIDQGLLSEMPSKVRLDHTKDKSHGDYATNIALMLAKQAKTSPLKLAQAIIDQLDGADFIEKTGISKLRDINVNGAAMVLFFKIDIQQVLTSAIF